MTDFFFQEPQAYDTAVLAGKLTPAQALSALTTAREVLSNVLFEEAAMEQAMRDAAAGLGLKAGPFFTPVRVAVTGKTVAPPLFGTLVILGREKVLARIDRAIEALKNE